MLFYFERHLLFSAGGSSQLVNDIPVDPYLYSCLESDNVFRLKYSRHVNNRLIQLPPQIVAVLIGKTYVLD